MQVRLLGPIDVLVDGAARPVPGLRRQAVLAALAVVPGEVVAADRLIEIVWGADPPATAPNALQQHVSFLRDRLGSRDAIVARPPGYALQLDGDATDAAEADRLVRLAAEATEPAERVRLLRAALGLWRGRALADAAELPGLRAAAERLDALWRTARAALVEERLRLGEHAAVLADLERMTRERPLDERLHGQLMLAQYRDGRRAEALDSYQRLRRALGEELGLDPGQALRDLHAAIVRRDPMPDPAGGAGPAAPTAVPAQLPLAVRGFTARRAELAWLDDLASGACVITGPAGVGKTSLAVHWAQGAAARFPDGQLYVSLRGFDPAGPAMDPAEALRGFLLALGLPAEKLPSGVDELAALFRGTVSGRRVLVVLDNARDADQARPLLPGAPGCLALVTSRDRLAPLVAAGAHPVALDLLTGAEARDLLASRLGADRVAAEPGAVEDIIASCARLPLALAVTAALAATRPGASLATQAAQLRAAAGGLDALDGGDAATDVRAVFSWSYRALDPAAARLFRLLGLHPGPDCTVPGAASLAGLGVEEVRPLLRRLVEANLVAERTLGRFALHDLLRQYATERARASEDAGELRLAAHRGLDHHLHTARAATHLIDPGRRPVDPGPPLPGVTIPPLGDRDRAMAWFTANHQVLTAAMRMAAADGFDTHTWALAWAVMPYLNWRGQWDEILAAEARAIDALGRLDEPEALGQAHLDVGRTYARLGRFDEAAVHLDQAIAQFAGIGYVDGQARVHYILAYNLQSQGRDRESLPHTERATELFRANGDLLWAGRSIGSQGWVLARLGEHERSLEACREAIELSSRFDDRFPQAASLHSMGYALHHLGRHGEAIDSFREALRLLEGFGDSTALADVFLHLGDALAAHGERPAAVECWRRALRLREDLADPSAEEVRERLSGDG
ncbi:AfsR/SARP family transcriptional regulator [Dactylosporangium salmoneum]|uniref:BTAD domain-containing putative transcriptional regulator n=1 Tax=Dactylosporangium salmoneum TaxID=53361 RepID=A0ABP5S978_9ACTN